MMDNIAKIKENKRKQRSIVEAHKKRMSEVVLPKLRHNKLKQREHILEVQSQIRSKGATQIEKARYNIRQQKKKHLKDIAANKEKIRLMQIKQRDNSQLQKDIYEQKVVPIIEKNREVLEERKSSRRLESIRKGKMVLAYSTVPSNEFSDYSTFSPKHSTIPNSEFASKANYSPKRSTVPDQRFADKLARPPKISTVPAPELAAANTYSPKLSTVPKPEFAEKITRSTKYSIVQFEKKMEESARGDE